VGGPKCPVYAAGRSPLARKHRGGEAIVWTPDKNIVDALDGAFHLAFKAVVPAGTNHLIGLDVSGSMSMGQVAGTFLTPRDAAAAMAMVTLRTEPWTHIIAFCDKVREIQISASERLDEVDRQTSSLPFGGTDCALPMIYALKNKLDVDTFHVLTDSETWAGNIQPVQALQQYRREMSKPQAKLIVVGMVSNGFTIADPQDGGMLDVVGFDTATPVLMADFARGGPPPKVLSGYDELDI